MSQFSNHAPEALECREDDGRYAYEQEQYEMMLDSLGTTDDAREEYEAEIAALAIYDADFEAWLDSDPDRDAWMEQDEPTAGMTMRELNSFIDRISARTAKSLAALKAMIAVGIG